ncbi:MAG: hypothetical protein ACYTBJ_10790, partial [Planctomycetota bacterium]
QDLQAKGGRAKVIMNSEEQRLSGTAGAVVVMLIILGLIVMSVVRGFWLAKVNDHYDKIISAYIAETTEYETDDYAGLKEKLLEGGIFIKMHRWDEESFVKDRQLYDQMLKKYDEYERKMEDARDDFIDSVINL